MKKAQTEYQDKYWNYQDGYKVDADPYEELVLNTPQPYDFSASRIHSEKKKRRRQTKGRNLRTNTFASPTDNRMKMNKKVNGEKCFVSSFSKKIEINPRVIVHQTGFMPETIQSSEFDDTSEIVSGKNSFTNSQN